MPKEYIGVDPQVWGSSTLSWGIDGTVQMTVAGPIGWRDPLLPRAGQRVIEGAEPVDPDNELDWHFTFTQRSEINKLIRLLRKARDQAFGRDE